MIWYNNHGDFMKISNMKNLNTALDEKQKEIEIHGNISDKVLRSGLISNIVFVGVVTLIVGMIGTIVLVLHT